MRPPGYEPGELPTAPLRDINHCKSSTGNIYYPVSLFASAKVVCFFGSTKLLGIFFCLLHICRVFVS